jgi:hypothetical protein
MVISPNDKLPRSVAIAISQLVRQAGTFDPGTYTFTVRVSDSQGIVGRRSVDVTIAAPAADHRWIM